MTGTSWTHLIARVLVRPLVGTWVRPNHLTTLRVITGVVACVFFALGTRAGMVWGGTFWLISAFLDRADGELARIGNMMSRGGHMYDYYADTAINAAFFLAIGLGLRYSWLGNWSLLLGLLTGVSMFLCSLFSEWLELRSPPGTRAYAGKWGFDPDDALSLMGPLAWLGWLSAVLVGASVGAPLMMTLVGIRLLRLRRAGTVSTPHAIAPKLSTLTE
jgi:phosphatidylglycerophosphate synthase